jgi:aspartokinase/homoserine dehydrogenase 1
MPGFISSSSDGINTTLGRGGSDYTAAIMAGALDATDLEIWTDVNGMYTANPKIVKQAQPIASISYQEAMELSHLELKYCSLHYSARPEKIPIHIKNTFEPEAEGTYISNTSISNGQPVKGISHIENITLITLEGPGMIGVTGSSRRLLNYH